jgi:hypothetical protein
VKGQLAKSPASGMNVDASYLTFILYLAFTKQKVNGIIRFMENLPAIIKSKNEIKLHHIVNMMRELQKAKSNLVVASWSAEHASMSEISVHLRKITNDINTISQHLHNVYKKERMVYTDVHKMYESLETVIGETNG